MASYSSIQTLRPISSINPAPRAAISLPKLPIRISLPKIPTSSTSKTHLSDQSFRPEITHQHPLIISTTTTSPPADEGAATPAAATSELYYAVLESIADRIEMHSNVAVQRDNWNSLLLSSINMSILAATTMAAVSPSAADHSLPLTLGSTILFAAATGLLAIMNTIQPSQLAEEQRNAARLFRQLQSKLNGPGSQAQSQPTKAQVDAAVEKVLTIDRAYPLPLLGKMIPKFPKKFSPAVWWPPRGSQQSPKRRRSGRVNNSSNGWSEELEAEMRAVAVAMRSKDREDYERLGSVVLKLNKALAVSGPVLSGVAAAASAVGLVVGGNENGWVAVAAGALAAAVNTLEHGGQIGMVVEMYRSCAGFFDELEDSIEGNLREEEVEERENGEVFAMKVGLALGRSPAEVKELAGKVAYCREEGTTPLEEFASKLF
ncbi:unnamed protein product [Linum trigynum]|uniref:F-box protein n=1 Tax=Linum trigynum TaxID=586398 RepID=A0AAV2FH58_9ROSI